MSDEPLEERPQVLLEPLPERPVERAQRLVEQQHLRPRSQRPGERDPLRLSARERRHVPPLRAREADELQRLRDARVALGTGKAAHPGPEPDVARHVTVWEQRGVLEHEADAPAVGRHLCDVDAVEEDAARRRLLQAGDHPQHGGLAGAARAEQREPLARRDLAG